MDVRKWIERMMKSRISEKQMYAVCTQLRFALEGELSLPESLQLMGQEAVGKKEKRFLTYLCESVEEGYPFSAALQASPIGYPPLLLQFVTAGEQNGNMVGAIRDAETWFSQRQKMQKQFLSAMIYPLLVGCMTVMAFLLLLLLVGPVIRDTYAGLNAPMPGMTEWILMMGDHILQYGGFYAAGFLLLLLVGGTGFHVLSPKPGFQKKWNGLIGRIPLLGKFYRQYWFIQIGQTIGNLLQSGLLPAESIGACCQIYRKSMFRWELQEMEAQVRKGYSFVSVLRSSAFLPDMVGKMLSVSEETGNAGRMLTTLSRYYQERMEHQLRMLASVLEPVMIILLGMGILLIAGSLFLPMMNSYQYLLV